MDEKRKAFSKAGSDVKPDCANCGHTNVVPITNQLKEQVVGSINVIPEPWLENGGLLIGQLQVLFELKVCTNCKYIHLFKKG